MKKIKQSVIYKITNLQDNKFYIGSAIDFAGRIRSHLSLLRRNKHKNKHLQNAWNLVGETNFKIDILEEVPILENETRSDFKKRLVDGREQYYLNVLLFADQNDNRFFEFGYNKDRIASSRLGSKQSEESKKKSSESHKGYKASEETKLKMKQSHTGINNHFFGKTHKKESIIKMSNSLKGKIFSDEHKRKISATRKKQKILQFDVNGIFLKEWESIGEASKSLNIHQPNISEACRNIRKTAGNFIWKYV